MVAWLGGLALSTVALLAVRAAHGGRTTEVAALVLTWATTTVVRFGLIRATAAPVTGRPTAAGERVGPTAVADVR